MANGFEQLIAEVLKHVPPGKIQEAHADVDKLVQNAFMRGHNDGKVTEHQALENDITGELKLNLTALQEEGDRDLLLVSGCASSVRRYADLISMRAYKREDELEVVSRMRAILALGITHLTHFQRGLESARRQEQPTPDHGPQQEGGKP